MIWGVGTGRCGTRSLAEDLGGLHEPQPWLGEDAIRAHHGDADARARTLERLAERAALPTPAIVDLKHSWVIPLIREVDPNPFFWWQARSPVECIESLLTGGAWTERDWHGTRKWFPSGWWEDGDTRFDRAITYWKGVNSLILDEYRSGGPNGWRVTTTHELRHHLNKYPTHVPLEPEQVQEVVNECGMLWIKMVGLQP